MASIHATAVLAGPKAVLIRGPSGAGKSRLALALLAAAAQGRIPFARLVADDRVLLEAHGGRLLARCPPAIAGLVERRGEGIAPCPFESVAVVGLIVDLAAPDAARLPAQESLTATIAGVTLPRLPVPAGIDALDAVLARCSGAFGAHRVLAAPHAERYPE